MSSAAALRSWTRVDTGDARPIGWLRAPAFDLTFIGGIAALALGCGLVLSIEPALFPFIFVANLWALGLHHVVATFTRIAFDRPSVSQYRPLLVGLPPVVLLAVVALGFGVGRWSLVTIYLYWQSFHYARQSYGIAQMYARMPQNAPAINQDLSRWVLYSVPLWGMLYRSHQDPAFFLGLPVWCVPVPELLVRAAGVLCLGLVGVWMVTQLRLLRQGQLPVPHAVYMYSHILIFTVGYVLMPSMDSGWLVVNIWHNAQYLFFVWHFNNKRFGERIDPQRRFISRLSQRQNVAWYVLTCLVISTVVYGLVYQVSQLVAFQTVSLAFIVGQALNYHHYIVDGIIWKRRAQAVALPAPVSVGS
jgi:hypothetical protein